MKPTQKQPEPLKNVAVTREDFELIKNAHGFGMGHICSCVDRSEALINRLLTERDEAIREVETQKANNAALLADRAHWRKEVERLKESAQAREQMLRDIGDNLAKADADLVEEKRRTAAYREVAMKSGHVCHSAACRPVCEMAETVDAEAQKLLADCGGEKKAE